MIYAFPCWYTPCNPGWYSKHGMAKVCAACMGYAEYVRFINGSPDSEEMLGEPGR